MSENLQFSALTTQELLQDHKQKGFKALPTLRHLEIELGNNVDNTLRETPQKVKLKAIKCRILVSAPPADILHIATLIN
jgi:hypothetical protein